MKEQLELIDGAALRHNGPIHSETMELVPYWLESMRGAIQDAFKFRHSRECTAWGMVTVFCWHNFLYGAGVISNRAHDRLERFVQRIKRWDALGDDGSWEKRKDEE